MRLVDGGGPQLSRRDALKYGLYGLVAAGTGALISCSSPEAKRFVESDSTIGGEWKLPSYNGVTVPCDFLLEASAYPNPTDGATVSNVVFTIDPAGLDNPIFHTKPNDPLTQYQGSWTILGVASANADGIFALPAHLARYQPQLFVAQKLNFDVYGRDRSGNPIRHESPNGARIVNVHNL